MIQSVCAISNVQHSVNENSVTLTYDGNPPYWINIRNDQKIGQNGGYVWAKTHSKEFTIDLSFANNPSNAFYYAIKDADWSSTKSFILSNSEESNCKELIKGQNVYSSNRINVIFIGIGYENLTRISTSEAIYNFSSCVVENQDRGFLSVEPFKSNKNKFNFWYVNKSGLFNYSTCEGYDNYYYNFHSCDYISLLQNCPTSNTIVAGLINKQIGSTGSTNIGALRAMGFISLSAPVYYDYAGNPLLYCEPTIEPGYSGVASTFVHEFGHAFGDLADEYYGWNLNKTFDGTSPKLNCYAGPTYTKEECLLQAPWKDLIGDGCGEPGIIDCTPNDPMYTLEVGCFEGCYYHDKGIFRSVNRSIMFGLDVLNPHYSFGSWNEKLLQDRLNNFG